MIDGRQFGSTSRSTSSGSARDERLERRAPSARGRTRASPRARPASPSGSPPEVRPRQDGGRGRARRCRSGTSPHPSRRARRAPASSGSVGALDEVHRDAVGDEQPGLQVPAEPVGGQPAESRRPGRRDARSRVRRCTARRPGSRRSLPSARTIRSTRASPATTITASEPIGCQTVFISRNAAIHSGRSVARSSSQSKRASVTPFGRRATALDGVRGGLLGGLPQVIGDPPPVHRVDVHVRRERRHELATDGRSGC